MKFIVTLSGRTVPSGIPPTLAPITVDPTTVSEGTSQTGNKVERLYNRNERIISFLLVASLMLPGKYTPDSCVLLVRDSQFIDNEPSKNKHE